MVELAKKKNYNEYLTFQNYDVYLNYEDEGLRITTVNQKNEKSKFAIVNSSQISDLSKGFLDDEDSLFTVIQDAITKPSEKIEISILEDVFIISFLIEFPVKKKLQIKINLKEEKGDPIDRLRKLIQRQAAKIEELTKRIDLCLPPSDKSVKVSPLIKTGTSFCSNYTISGNGKIATRNANGNGTYYHLHAQDPLPQENFVQFFEVKISSQSYPKTPYIFVGCGTANTCNSGSANIYSTDGYFIHLYGCAIYKSGVARQSTLFSISGSILRIYYDYSKQLIWFEVDGDSQKISISKEHRNEKLYPIIMSAYNLDLIEFL